MISTLPRWSTLSPHTRQIIVWGTMWGLFVAAAEGVVIQETDAGWGHALQFWLIQWGLPMWCAVGCLQLVVARRAERRGWKAVIAGWLLVSLGWASLQPWLYQWSNLLMHRTAARETRADVMRYNLWPCLFYGGLLVGAYVLSLRTERTRSLLQDAAIARSRTTALRGEIELAALQRHVDPALLLDVMGDVEQRYRSSPEQADVLLGRLVEFLRCAMPGLKEHGSTLAAELQLATARAHLQFARSSGALRSAARWTLIVPATLPTLPFPGQFVLPLMALAAAHAEPRLVVRCMEGGVRIEVHELGRALPDDFTHQALLSFRALLGDRFDLHVGTELEPDLSLMLHSPHHPGADDAPR